MNGNESSVPLGQVLLEEPVDEDNSLEEDNNGIYNVAMSRNISWEYKNVSLTRIPGYGFGIAVSGGSDNPHFANGDPAIAISDVLKGGPAEGKLNINDRIITANTIKLENVDYGTAVQVLRDSGPTVNLIIKRRIVNHHQKISLNKLTTSKLKNIQPSDYGISLIVKVFVKESRNSALVEGDEVVAINGLDVAKLFDYRKAVNSGSLEKVELSVVKQNEVVHRPQQSYDSGNLYVQPPTRKFERLEKFPPRPPPPVEESEPRYINFIKKNNLGLKLTGGNNCGIFIEAVQSPASGAGLAVGDLIIKVNDVDFTSLTKEEAIESLGRIPQDSLVSFIVKRVSGYETVLREKNHDCVDYRVNFDYGKVKRGDVVNIFDTFCNGFYLGTLGSEKVKIPCFNKAKELSQRPYTKVKLVKKSRRPVFVFSNFNELINEKVRNFDVLESNNSQEIRNFLNSSSRQCLILLKNSSLVLELIDFSPIVLILKTEDRLLKRKSYGSLLRSFKKKEEDLDRKQRELNCRVIEVVEGDWMEKLMVGVGEEGGKGVWVEFNGGEINGDLAIPNYTSPLPYSVNVNEEKKVPINGHQLRKTPPSTLYQRPLPIPNKNNIPPPLAHSPMDTTEDDNNPPPPPLDRTKKPQQNSKEKPLPPPKPAKLQQQPRRRQENSDSYYLNLPLNSKVFNSAFEPYKPLPLIQNNTTSGTFSSKGGLLRQRNCKRVPIEVEIPEGAIPVGEVVTVWFHVVDEHFSGNGGGPQVLSPLIKFGPENYRFLRPIEIRIPQYSRNTNASVLMNSQRSWSRIGINSDLVENDGDFKIVSLSVQQF